MKEYQLAWLEAIQQKRAKRIATLKSWPEPVKPPRGMRRAYLCRFLLAYWTERGCAPTQEEIAEALAMDYTWTLSVDLNKLEGRGYITRDYYVARSIRLTDKGRALAKEVEECSA